MKAKIIQLLKDAIAGNPVGGELTVDSLQSSFPETLRADLVQALKHACRVVKQTGVVNCAFANGRHRKLSRATWGDRIPASIQRKADLSPASRKELRGPRMRLDCNGLVQEFELKLGEPVTIRFEAVEPFRRDD